MNRKWRIAVVGCGLIANSNYLPEVKNMPNAEIVAVCDIIPERAKQSAEKFGIPRYYVHIDDLLKDCDFEILLDLTSIDAHFEINLKALQAGKHLYSQKPIATTVEETKILIEEAKKRNLKISASPIHMLRPDIQEARRLIKEGIIGKVSFIRCSSSHGGPEYFQFRDVDPSWFYKPGIGPLLDLGVHGLHQVTGLLGPAKRVACFSGISEKKRIVRTGAFDGKEIEPLVDDNTLILLDFGEATFAFVDATYCVKSTKAPYMEIYGSKGTITFTRDPEKPIMLFLDEREKGIRGWTEPIYYWQRVQQSCGVKDLIEALEENREPVLTPQHALHVIEIMEKAYISAKEGKAIELETIF